ncbi:hypothetical protein ACLMJK_004620 [Lecanora helva]
MATFSHNEHERQSSKHGVRDELSAEKLRRIQNIEPEDISEWSHIYVKKSHLPKDPVRGSVPEKRDSSTLIFPSALQSLPADLLVAIGQRIDVAMKDLLNGELMDEPFRMAVQNQSQRFTMWAINLGLYQTGHGSLDYRFRDAPTLYDFARAQLLDLEKYIDIVRKALIEEQQNLNSTSQYDQQRHGENTEATASSYCSSSDDEDFESYDQYSSATTALENVGAVIDRLYRLSFKIRRPATRFGLTKAQNYKQIDPETNIDLIDSFAGFDKAHVVETFAQYQTSHDLDPQRLKDHYLVNRLAKANTRRRQQIGHWKYHKLKLDRSADMMTSRAKVSALPYRQNLGERQYLEVMPLPTAPTISMPSTATKAENVSLGVEDAASVTSTSTYAAHFNDPEFNPSIPQLPEKIRKQKEFECPYCHILCSQRTSHNKAWEGHVLRDLRPYLCTYEQCEEPNQLYDSFSHWLKHESSCHKTVRRCKQHPAELFSSMDTWEEHLNAQHPDSVGAASFKLAETIAIDNKRTCPICSTPNVQPEHIAFHLHTIALFALPKATGLEDGDAASGSSRIIETSSGSLRDRFEGLEDLSFSSEDEFASPEDLPAAFSGPDESKSAQHHPRSSDSNRPINWGPSARRIALRDFLYNFGRVRRAASFITLLAGIETDWKLLLIEWKTLVKAAEGIDVSHGAPTLDHPDVLRNLDLIASSLYRLGHFEQAENMLTQVTESPFFKKDDLQTLSFKQMLGYVYEAQGKVLDAEELRFDAYDSYTKLFSSQYSDSDYDESWGLLLSDFKKFDEAEVMFRQILARRKKALGEKNPRTMDTITDLAIVLEAQGEDAEAEYLLQQAPARLSSDQNPGSLDAAYCLARVYCKQDRYTEAQNLYQEAIKASERWLSSSHPYTLRLQVELVRVMRALGRFEDAQCLCEQVVAKCKELLGADHVLTREAQDYLASVIESEASISETMSSY